ncbi:putative calcium-binding protein [Golovinomyces cichoracearum]|uniref:Putative calcium-binding protein n=2 Tax=Golovinomyces cichoracearum TaxID=62708 RepID=A0A420HEA2_9PEZI|nr:putative calcium-binding protein [Golovinomyces cichoracearum]
MATFYLFTLLLFTLSNAISPGRSNDAQKPIKIDPEVHWEKLHMAEEHNIELFDRASFFSLHDFDSNGVWDTHEILKMYGMDDPSAKDVPEVKKSEVAKTILDLIDTNNDNLIDKREFIAFQGFLPDFGLGPGHHFDMETEYEIHHWQKYHNKDTKEEDLTHPEDIEHFTLHDKLEDEADALAAMDKLSIVEGNIPAKFKKESA